MNSFSFYSLEEEFTMVDFKLSIADPSNGKTYQKEVKDKESTAFLGKNVGESVKGDTFGFDGYEFLITGGSDNCGFPMRRGILGIRKKLSLLGGVGLRERMPHGSRRKKTVCGQKIKQKPAQ
jgi:small subunit ribosomal protein S6e